MNARVVVVVVRKEGFIRGDKVRRKNMWFRGVVDVDVELSKVGGL